MRRAGIVLFLFFCLLAMGARAAHTQATLVLSDDMARPGDTVWAGVLLKMEPEWHTYWKNSGDAGMPTPIALQLPSGVTAGEIQWPLPEKLPPAEVTTYGYNDEAMLLVPLLVTLNMIPKVAMGPLVIVWFSYGILANILIAFAICFFPILLTTARGLSDVEPDLLDLVKSLRGSRWILFRKIQLPGSLPYIFSGMKVGAILAVAGAIVGEFIASDRGLGYLMTQVQASLDTPAMVMAVVLLTLLGVGLYGLVLGLERLFVGGYVRLQ